jgi:hypothetical protein
MQPGRAGPSLVEIGKRANLIRIKGGDCGLDITCSVVQTPNHHYSIRTTHPPLLLVYDMHRDMLRCDKVVIGLRPGLLRRDFRTTA